MSLGIQIGQWWKHKKTGKLYRILAISRVESDPNQLVVAYVNPVDSSSPWSWSRPFEEFCEKFEATNK